jgi:hypothetical protein
MPKTGRSPNRGGTLPKSKQGKLEVLKQVSEELTTGHSASKELERVLSRLEAEWTDPPHAASHRGKVTEPKCTVDVVRSVLKHVSQGMPITTAFGLEGIPKSLLGEWAEAAARGGQPYQLVTELLRVAQDLAEANFTRVVAAACLLDWRAAAWWLERRRPEHWGKASTDERSSSPQFSGALVAQRTVHRVSSGTLQLPPLPPSEFDDEGGSA